MPNNSENFQSYFSTGSMMEPVENIIHDNIMNDNEGELGCYSAVYRVNCDRSQLQVVLYSHGGLPARAFPAGVDDCPDRLSIRIFQIVIFPSKALQLLVRQIDHRQP